METNHSTSHWRQRTPALPAGERPRSAWLGRSARAGASSSINRRRAPDRRLPSSCRTGTVGSSCALGTSRQATAFVWYAAVDRRRYQRTTRRPLTAAAEHRAGSSRDRPLPGIRSRATHSVETERPRADRSCLRRVFYAVAAHYPAVTGFRVLSSFGAGCSTPLAGIAIIAGMLVDRISEPDRFVDAMIVRFPKLACHRTTATSLRRDAPRSPPIDAAGHVTSGCSSGEPTFVAGNRAGVKCTTSMISLSVTSATHFR